MVTSALREYYRPLLNWWWLILIAAIIAAVSAYFYLRGEPQMFQSSTTIMVGEALEDPNPNSAEIGLTQQLAQAYAEIAVRGSMQQATMAALGLDKMPEYKVQAKQDSSLLEITVIAGEPETAQAVAQELVNQLILLSPTDSLGEDRQAFVDEQLAKLENDIRATEDEIKLQEAELSNLFSARDISNAQEQIAALRNKERTLRTNYSDLLSSAQRNAVNRVTVLEPAALPNRPIPSELPRNLALATAMGLVLGATGAYLLEFFDDSVKESKAIGKELGLPLLASIPVSTEKNGLVMSGYARTTVTESYRELGIKVGLAIPDADSFSLLVTSPTPNDGKSVTVANLGIALARSGRKVIILDGDLHRPRQHEYFNLSNRVGVTMLLRARPAELDDVLQSTGYPGLAVITSGPSPANASELLGSKRMAETLEQLKTRADIVLVDSPPALALVDPVVMAPLVDGVILVVRAGSTRRSAAAKVVRMFEDVRTTVVGIVLNGVRRRQSTYGRMYGYGDATSTHHEVTSLPEPLPEFTISDGPSSTVAAEPQVQPAKRGGTLTDYLKPASGGKAADS